MAISGDARAFQCGTLYDNADPSSGKPVAGGFVGAGVSGQRPAVPSVEDRMG